MEVPVSVLAAVKVGLDNLNDLEERVARLELYVKVYHQEQREIHGQIVAEIEQHEDSLIKADAEAKARDE